LLHLSINGQRQSGGINGMIISRVRLNLSQQSGYYIIIKYMKEIENIIEQILPKASVEDMTVAIKVIIKQCDEECEELAKVDPLEQQAKETWLKLQEDIFEHGLHAEFAEFLLENPDLNAFEIDRQFRDEWDL
jgi:hypothetical protein